MALYYWVGGTNTWNATAAGKWSNNSGVLPATYTTNPGASDDVIFDSFSTAGAVVTLGAGSNATVGSITFATFPGTFTFAANLSSGNTTLGASTTYTASGGNPTTYTFTPRNVNSTFTANGNILPTNLFINLNATTLTFAGNADFGGNLDTATTAHTIKAAATTTIDLRIGSNIITRATTINPSEHVTIKGYGSGKTCATNTGTINLRLTFVNGSSYTSIAGSNGCSGTSLLTVEVGGNFTSNNTSHIFTNSGTVTLSGFNSSTNSSFYALSASSTGTIVLSTDTVIKSSITTSTLATTISSTGSAKLLLEGNLVLSGGNNLIIDKLEFSGSTVSNVTGNSGANSNLQIKEFSINKTSGGSVFFNTTGNFTLFIPSLSTYSWTHTAGTVTQGSNCTIRIWGNVVSTSIFNYSAPSSSTFTFRDIQFYGAGVVNLNTKLNATKISITPAIGTISISSSGLLGFDTESLVVLNTTATGKTVILKSGVTYNITVSLVMLNPGGSVLALNASTSGTKAKFYLELAAPFQDVESVNPTDIDSHGANNVGPPIYKTIYSQNGVITASTWNWSLGNAPPPIAPKTTVGYTFVN
jgi:hypothetical protein